MNSWEITDKIFIIKNTDDEGQNYKTIVSKKKLYYYIFGIYICICLFVLSNGQPHWFLFISEWCLIKCWKEPLFSWESNSCVSLAGWGSGFLFPRWWLFSTRCQGSYNDKLNLLYPFDFLYRKTAGLAYWEFLIHPK